MMDFFLSIFLTVLLWDRAVVRSQDVPGLCLSQDSICQIFCPVSSGATATCTNDEECNKKRNQISNGYTVIEDSAFKLNRTLKTWNDARNACIKEGGHLATSDTKAKKQYLDKLFESIQDKPLGVWIGVHDHFQEGDWVTVLDEPLRFGVYQWGANQPDNAHGGQNCGRIRVGGMDDFGCSQRLPFICEISLKDCDLSLFKTKL